MGHGGIVVSSYMLKLKKTGVLLFLNPDLHLYLFDVT